MSDLVISISTWLKVRAVPSVASWSAKRLEKRRLELEAAEQAARVRLETAQKAGDHAKTIARLEPDIAGRQVALEADRAKLAALVEKKASLETERKTSRRRRRAVALAARRC